MVQRIVVGPEWPRRCAAGDLLHHRGFDFQISALVEELPQRLQHLRTLDEHLARLEIREQVHVALPVAQFHIRKPMKFLRQREHGFGQERQALHVDGQFACPGAKQVTGDADVVAQIEQLIERETFFADRVEPYVDLQPLPSLLQSGKPRLALLRGWP